MKARKKVLSCLFIVTALFTVVLNPVLAFVPNQVSTANTVNSLQTVIDQINSDPTHNGRIIFKDEQLDFVLYYLEGKLQCYKNGVITTVSSDFSGNVSAMNDSVVGTDYSVQVSPDKNRIVFYDSNGRTFVYSVKNSILESLSIPLAKVVWNTAGNDIEFLMKQNIFRESMDMAFAYQTGLYVKKTDGTISRLLEDSNSVNFIARKSDGIHFTLQRFLNPLDLRMSEALPQEIVYNSKTGAIQYVPHIPLNTKVIYHDNMKDFTGLMQYKDVAGQKIYASGNYLLLPAGSKYLRLNTLTGQKTQIPQPIAVYKGYIYYFKTPYVSGPVYKMNIKTLTTSKTSIGYAASYGYTVYKNFLYFLNPQKDSAGNFKDVPYALNLDTGKLVKNASAPKPNEYHIFVLQNKYRLCVSFAQSVSPSVHLEAANGRIVISNVVQYSNGYFYQTGLSQDKFPVINKVDSNGKVVKTVFKAFNKYVQYSSMYVLGNSLYFTVSGSSNVYKVDMVTGKYKKY